MGLWSWLTGGGSEHCVTVLHGEVQAEAPVRPPTHVVSAETERLALAAIRETGVLKKTQYKEVDMGLLAAQYRQYQTPARFVGTPASVPPGAHPSVGVEPCEYCRATGQVHAPKCPKPKEYKGDIN